MTDEYVVTYGPAMDQRFFPYGPEGLRAAWEFARGLGRTLYHIGNPKRADLGGDGQVDEGLTEDERDQLDAWDAEAYEAANAGRLAEEREQQQRLDVARGK